MAAKHISEQDSKGNVLQQNTSGWYKGSRLLFVASLLFVGFCTGVLTGVFLTRNSNESEVIQENNKGT